MDRSRASNSACNVSFVGKAALLGDGMRVGVPARSPELRHNELAASIGFSRHGWLRISFGKNPRRHRAGGCPGCLNYSVDLALRSP